jgi:hypothetical protein
MPSWTSPPGSVARRSPRGGRFSKALAEERPLVLVIEDLHWADETASSTSSTTSWTGRPAFRCSSFAAHGRSCSSVGPDGVEASRTPSPSRSRPLSDDETARLISELLERSVLPSEAQQALLARAGGNPLYAEQFARMLAEGGALEDDARLPETVQGLIAARLDLLPPDEKDPAPGRGGPRQDLLVGRARVSRGRGRRGARRASALARAEAVRAPRTAFDGRGRGRALLPPHPRPGRRVQPDSARRPRREAQADRRMDRVARAPGGPVGDARTPLPAGARS